MLMLAFSEREVSRVCLGALRLLFVVPIQPLAPLVYQLLFQAEHLLSLFLALLLRLCVQRLHGLDAVRLLKNLGLVFFALFYATLLDDVAEQVLLDCQLILLVLRQIGISTAINLR